MNTRNPNTSNTPITHQQWESRITALTEQRDWEEMWRQVTEVPLEWSIRFLLRLKEANWQPKREAERAAFTNLVRLAKECSQIEAPTPGKFVHSYVTLRKAPLLAVSPDVSMIASLAATEQRPDIEYVVQLRNLRDGAIFKTLTGHTDAVISATFSPDGRILATGSYDATVRLWSVLDRELLNVLHGPTHQVVMLKFSPDGKLLIGMEPEILWIWSFPDGEVLSTQQHVGRFTFTPDGKMVTTRHQEDGSIYLYDVLDNTVLTSPQEQPNWIGDCILIPENQLLFGTDWTYGGRVWRLSDNKLLKILEERGRIVDIVMSPDGRRLVTQDANYIGRLWDVSKGTLLKTLEGQNACFAISADGQILAGGDREDGFVQLWSLPDGVLLKRLRGHPECCVTKTAISPDKQILVSDGDDVRLWRLGWMNIEQVIIEETSAEDLKWVEKQFHTDEFTGTDRTWLEFLLVLMRRYVSRQARHIVQSSKASPKTEFDTREIEWLLEACRTTDDPEMTIQICEYLVENHHPEAIDVLCAKWMETREPQLAQAISQGGYVANHPFNVRIWSALQAGRDDMIVEHRTASVLPLLDACNDTDPTIGNSARDMLAQLLEQIEMQEELCRLVIESNHPLACEYVLTRHYAPRDVHQRALLYILTQQWEQYEQLDVDQHILSEVYPMLTFDIRKRITPCIRQSGRIEWLRILVGTCHETQLRQMSDDEWTHAVTMLNEHKDWKQMWRLTQTAPAERSVQLLLMLDNTGWSPTHNAEQTIFAELVGLVKKCKTNQADMPEGIIPSSTVLEEHNTGVACIAISPDEHLLASGSKNGVVHLWALPKNAIPNVVHTRISAFGQEGDVLLNRGNLPSDMVIEPRGDVFQNVDHAQSEETSHQYRGAVMNCLAFSPDGQRLVMRGGHHGVIWIWYLQDGVTTQILDPDFMREISLFTEESAHVYMNPDGKTIFTGHVTEIQQPRTFVLQLRSFPDGEILNTLRKELIGIEEVVLITPDRQTLIIGNKDGTIQLWRLWDGELLQTLEGPTVPVESLTMSPDGDILASRSKDNTIHLWRMPEKETMRVLEGYTHSVTCIEINPDGRLLVGGSQEGMIYIWSLPDGRLLQSLEGHIDKISCLAMSADGHVLASGSHDHTVRLWNLKWADLRRLSADQLNSEDLKFIEKTLQQDKITESQRTWLEFLLALTRWQKRFDVDLGEAGKGIPSGEFDVEIGA